MIFSPELRARSGGKWAVPLVALAFLVLVYLQPTVYLRVLQWRRDLHDAAERRWWRDRELREARAQQRTEELRRARVQRMEERRQAKGKASRHDV